MERNKDYKKKAHLCPSCTRPSPSSFKFCIINAIPRRISSCHNNSFVQFIHLPIKKADFQRKFMLQVKIRSTSCNILNHLQCLKVRTNAIQSFRYNSKKKKRFTTNKRSGHDGLKIENLPAIQCSRRQRATLLWVVLSLLDRKISFPIGENLIAVYRSNRMKNHIIRKCTCYQTKWQKNIDFKNIYPPISISPISPIFPMGF